MVNKSIKGHGYHNMKCCMAHSSHSSPPKLRDCDFYSEDLLSSFLSRQSYLLNQLLNQLYELFL